MSKKIIIIDFETRSRCDLKTKGAYNYASDPTTDILCMAWAFADQDEKGNGIWFPNQYPQEMPAPEIFEDAELVMAHNANFDQMIYEFIAVPEYGFPAIPEDKWYCTSAQARVNAMPASLDDLTRALDSRHKKDHRGKQLIRKLSIPQKDGTFNEDAGLMQEMGEYCVSDVAATKAAVNSTRSMTQREHEDWLINERINDRGMRIDRDLATYAMKYASAEQAEISKELIDITDGEVTKHTQTARIRDWVLSRVSEDVAEAMIVYKDGEKKYSMAKDIRATMLGKFDAGEWDFPAEVADVIQAMDDGNKSSVAKFKRMIDRADPDTDRVHGAFVYAGASQTLRYASRGLQLHNFKRECFSAEETERLKAIMMVQGILKDPYGEILPVMETLSKLLRPALIPDEGNVFVVGDWSSIEARALPWLANSRSAEKKLDLFRAGKDVYITAAAEIYSLDEQDIIEDLAIEEDCDVKKWAQSKRQVGKVAELALGYGGAAGAFNSMAKNYGVFLPDHEVKNIVDTWRYNNRWAVSFWDSLLNAAMLAVRNPDTEFHAGRVSYEYWPELMNGTLICRLPGDLVIQYPDAKIEILETKFGPKATLTAMKANWKPAADQKKWPRIALWRGLLAENITQAFCARLLRDLVRTFDPEIVAHVHDEVVLETSNYFAEQVRDDLKEIMNHVPPWAEGLPLSAEPEIMTRYGK